jgi:AcrR family transcriptional regulator
VSRPFHHGNLRAVLLEQAEAMLRETGADGLSLRELARQAGVSHGAPRSHFIDRRALLDALAVQGFARFTQLVETASAGSEHVAERLRLVGHAYVDFAVDNAALMELMFATKVDGGSDAVDREAARLFGVLDDALADPGVGDADDDAHTRFKLVFASTMQGAAALVVAGRLGRDQADTVVDDATEALLSSALGARVLPKRERRPTRRIR